MKWLDRKTTPDPEPARLMTFAGLGAVQRWADQLAEEGWLTASYRLMEMAREDGITDGPENLSKS